MNVNCAVFFLLFLSAKANIERSKCRNVSITESDSSFENNIIFHGIIDDRLLNGLKELYGSVTLALDECPGGVEEIINITKDTDKYMIYVGVNDFYKFNYNYVSKHLIYAGDLKQSAYSLNYTHCKKNNLKNAHCERKSHDYHKVMLMTTNVEKNPLLHKFIKDYMGNTKKSTAVTKIHNNTPNIVIVCYNETNIRNRVEILDFNNWTRDIIIKHTYECEDDVKKFQSDLLAVVAPKPFETDYDIIVPVLLYKPPCDDDNISMDNNYLNIIKSCGIYKDALIHLMEKADWKRAAIISDNTAHSEDIETEITALFEEKDIVFTVQRCVEDGREKCNFTQALESLKNADARVFIANVNEYNLKRLYEDAKNIMSVNRKLNTWILRNSLDEYGDEKMMGDVFTISLAPTIPDRKQYDDLRVYSNNAYQVDYSRIIEGISKIRTAYGQVKNEYDITERRIFFRKLKEKIDDGISSNVIAYIIKNSPEIVGKLQDRSFHMKDDVKYKLDMYECSLRSNNFLYPCDESNFLKILVILVAVAASALLVTVIYNYYIMPATNRYRNFA